MPPQALTVYHQADISTLVNDGLEGLEITLVKSVFFLGSHLHPGLPEGIFHQGIDIQLDVFI